VLVIPIKDPLRGESKNPPCEKGREERIRNDMGDIPHKNLSYFPLRGGKG